MKRTLLVCAWLAAAAAALGAQESAPANPYEGASNPPSDSAITTPAPADQPQAAPLAKPKPSPSHHAARPAPQQSNAAPAPQPAPPTYAAETVPGETSSAPANDTATSSVPAHEEETSRATAADAAANCGPVDGTDAGLVEVAAGSSPDPELHRRDATPNPDGDIVHPAPLPSGELAEGTTIRVRLLDRLSTTENRPGDPFRARVATGVVRDGQVLIPAGSMIEGKVLAVSSGRPLGRGSMRLHPETLTMPDGSRFRLYAQLSEAPGSKDKIGYEGKVLAGSRFRKDGIEYGGAVGAGAVTGALLAGPGGALAGTLVGASVITVHLLADHPQAALDDGSVLLFTLSEPLNLAPEAHAGN